MYKVGEYKTAIQFNNRRKLYIVKTLGHDITIVIYVRIRNIKGLKHAVGLLVDIDLYNSFEEAKDYINRMGLGIKDNIYIIKINTDFYLDSKNRLIKAKGGG